MEPAPYHTIGVPTVGLGLRTEPIKAPKRRKTNGNGIPLPIPL